MSLSVLRTGLPAVTRSMAVADCAEVDAGSVAGRRHPLSAINGPTTNAAAVNFNNIFMNRVLHQRQWLGHLRLARSVSCKDQWDRAKVTWNSPRSGTSQTGWEAQTVWTTSRRSIRRLRLPPQERFAVT